MLLMGRVVLVICVVFLLYRNVVRVFSCFMVINCFVDWVLSKILWIIWFLDILCVFVVVGICFLIKGVIM